MNIRLRHKYTVYNGDTDQGRRCQNQYGTGRSGGGNGKRNISNKVTDDFKAACARDCKATARPPKSMVVNGKSGHRVMVIL